MPHPNSQYPCSLTKAFIWISWFATAAANWDLNKWDLSDATLKKTWATGLQAYRD